MDCPECGATMLAFPVPPEHRSALPAGLTGAALCTRCLTLQPVEDPPTELPDVAAISDAIPADADAAVPLALLLGRLENLALYRSEIAALLDAVERAGVDPLLVLDRLAADPDLEPVADLRRRRKQLEALL
ncbi:MAG: DUF6276 family protein [Salinirussus sp.]